MTNEHLIHALHHIGAIKFGNYTLKSGEPSRVYIDLRQIISNPDILRAVSHCLWSKISKCQFDILCGVPYTALPIATCLSLQHNIPMIMRRKEKKSYGTKQQIEGGFQPGQTCLIIEDLITTGSSVLETAQDLKEVGLEIKDVAMLINREQGGLENLASNNIHSHAVFTLNEVLQIMLTSSTISPDERSMIKTIIQEHPK